MTEPISYGDAVAELEAILGEIEAEDVDVDLLSAKVKRAAELIRFCRERIDTTRIEVEEIVSGLDSTASSSGEAGSGDEGIDQPSESGDG